MTRKKKVKIQIWKTDALIVFRQKGISSTYDTTFDIYLPIYKRIVLQYIILETQMLEDGRVKVYIEKPDEKDCFHHTTCYMPEYTWEDIFGFSDEEMAYYKELVESQFFC